MADCRKGCCADCNIPNMEESCHSFLGKDYALAMAYVPWQKWNGIYENLEEAFCEGTIFPELNKPFTGRRCV